MTVLTPALQGETGKPVLSWALSSASDMTVQMHTLQGNSFRLVLMPALQGGRDRLVLILEGIHVMTSLMQAPQEGSGMTVLMSARQEMQVSPGYGSDLFRIEIELILRLLQCCIYIATLILHQLLVVQCIAICTLQGVLQVVQGFLQGFWSPNQYCMF